MLTKRTNGAAEAPRLSKAIASIAGSAIDRRAFLKRSGLAAGGIAAASIPLGMVKKAEAASAATGNITIIKSGCTHCAIGCTVMAEVLDGVLIGQEPGRDRPSTRGADRTTEPPSHT